LPSITGKAALAPRFPRPKTADPVRHYGNGVTFHGQVVGEIGVFVNRLGDPGYARGIHQGQILAALQLAFWYHLDLAAPVGQQDPVRHLADTNAWEGSQLGQERVDLLTVVQTDHQITDPVVGKVGNQVDGPEVAPEFGHRGQHPGQGTRAVGQFHLHHHIERHYHGENTPKTVLYPDLMARPGLRTAGKTPRGRLPCPET